MENKLQREIVFDRIWCRMAVRVRYHDSAGHSASDKETLAIDRVVVLHTYLPTYSILANFQDAM